MRLELSPPPLVSAIVAACAAAGGRAYLVGGSVRDHLLGAPIKDWDLEVYGLDADALERTLRRAGPVNTVGKAFSVFKVGKGGQEIDVSIPRRDSKIGAGHRGILALGDPHMSLNDAVRRRDLTVNAMMLALPDGELVDPSGGLADLRAGALREVDRDTFLEDPLRALRVVQFAARLGFRPTPSLERLCEEAALDELPSERIFLEWEKLLTKSRAPSAGLAVAHRTRVLDRVFPGLVAWDAAQGAALDRAAAARDRFDEPGRALALMVATWLAPSVGGAIREEHPVVRALDRLGLHRVGGYPARERVLQALAEPDLPATDAALRHASTRCELALTLRLRQAHDPERAEAWEAAGQRAEALGILFDKPVMLLQGRDLQALGVRGGPAMGALLKHAYAAQLDGRVTSREDALALLRADGHLT